MVDERVEDGRHQKIRDSSAGTKFDISYEYYPNHNQVYHLLAEARGEGVACADDVLVEESGRPDLARDEAAAENTDEETES